MSLNLCASVFIIFFSALVRFHDLDAQSFWNDEGSSYVQATRSFADIADNAARDIHPPGYYWLLAIWRGLTGDSEFALRALSAFASILTVAFTFSIGRQLFNPAAGLAAALLVAFNTFSIYYSQEARMYALLALWSAAGMWVVVESRKSKVKSQKSEVVGGRHVGTRYNVSGLRRMLYWVVGLGLINAAGLYTQYAYPFMMVAQGMIVALWSLASRQPATHSPQPLAPRASRYRLITRYSLLVTFILSNLFALLLYLPWLPVALRQITTWPSTGQPIPPVEALTTILGWFTFGITYATNSSAVTSAILLLAIVGLIGWVWQRQADGLLAVTMPVIWALLPVILFLALGLFRPANLKFLLPSQVGFALLVGAGVGGWWQVIMRKRTDTQLRVPTVGTRFFASAAVLVLFVCLLTSLAPLYTDPQFQRPDYRHMVSIITTDARPGDAIILDAPNQEEVFRYYYRGDAPIFPLPPGLGGNDLETQAAAREIISQYKRIFVLLWGETERDPGRMVEGTLDTEAFSAGEDQWFKDVRLARYETPAPLLEPIPVNARFGESIRLDHYALSARSLQPGAVLQIELGWVTDVRLTIRYKVFLQLLDKNGNVVAQRDSEPGGDVVITPTWIPGEIVLDRHGLFIPETVAPGKYEVILGLYDIDNPASRLPVEGGDYLTIWTLELQPF